MFTFKRTGFVSDIEAEKIIEMFNEVIDKTVHDDNKAAENIVLVQQEEEEEEEEEVVASVGIVDENCAVTNEKNEHA